MICSNFIVHNSSIDEHRKQCYIMTTNEHINTMSIIINILDTTFVMAKKGMKHEYKLAAKRVLESTKKFVNLANSKLPENDIDNLDSDGEEILKMIEWNIKASKEGKEIEFMEHIEKFFES